MRNVFNKILSIVFVLLLTVSATVPAFAAPNPADQSTQTGKTVVVSFEYDDVKGVNGTITFDNPTIFSDVSVSSENGFDINYNPSNGRIFCYSATAGKCIVKMTLTVADTAVEGDKCIITFENETTADGNFSTVPSYSYDKATVVIDNIEYDALQVQIDRANDCNEMDYTAESWAAMTEELAEAKALMNNADTQDEVDAQTAALKAAIDALIKLDYKALEKQINTANGLLPSEADYTAATWTAMTKELAEAKALLGKARTQEEINTAAAELEAAIKALAKLDYKTLDTQIERAESKVEDEYTSESWTTMIAKYNVAKQVRTTARTQEEIDTAAAELKAAIDALELKPVVTPLNYTEINKQIEIAESKNKSEYTAESWAVMADALAAAKKAKAEATTQLDLDAAAKTLKDAIDALVRVDVDVPVTGEFALAFPLLLLAISSVVVVTLRKKKNIKSR